MADTLRAARFAMVPEWVLFSDLSDRAVRLYAVLHRKADDDGTNAFPSRRWLCSALDCAGRTLDRALEELVALGAVTKRPRFREDGSRTSNEYVVRFDPPATGDEAPPATGDEGPLVVDDEGPVVTGDGASTHSPGSTDSPVTETSPAEADDPDDSPFPDVATEETIEHARGLCRTLAAYVKRNGHALPTTASARDGWLVEMERLVRIGPPGDVDWPDDPGGAAGEIERVMLWALDVSDFWPANIRSAPTLRAKFTQLRAQANRSNGRRGRTPTGDEYRAAAARLREMEGSA